ncbi:MAG: thioredoxin domain-containing protein [Desulfobacterales bacterium]|nr:thioredoxin domain-containing protein [Desulfobacterales bacterium]
MTGRVERLRSEFEIGIQWIAFPLHPETPPEGRSLQDLFAGRNYDIPQTIAHLKQVASDLELPFGDREMTYNSRLAQELGKWAEQMGKGDAFHDAAFRAYFADGHNIANVNVLTDIATSVGLDDREAQDVIDARTFKEAVDKDWSRSYQLGVTAVPTFMMNGMSLVGAQPYEKLAQMLKANRIQVRHQNTS